MKRIQGDVSVKKDRRTSKIFPFFRKMFYRIEDVYKRQLFGIPNDVAMQVVGVGFIIGVIQDSCETALNSSTDVLFTASAEYAQWRRQGRDLPI